MPGKEVNLLTSRSERKGCLPGRLIIMCEGLKILRVSCCHPVPSWGVGSCVNVICEAVCVCIDDNRIGDR